MGHSDLETLLAKLAATPKRRAPVEQFSGTRRYEIKRRLGSGTFGQVYEARDREYGTLVALKALRASHPDWILRFKREFRTVRDLSHPNLARMYELFCERDQWYLTMELVDGIRFDQHVKRAPDQLRPCFAQLAIGIAALHAADCLHRDIKPPNALVETTGRVVLLDFGLATREGQIDMAQAGTPPFMAPELSTDGEPTTASDWYAFGVMLYASLAGRMPFGGDMAELEAKKLEQTPARPSSVRSGVDPALESLALRLLDPDADRRPGRDAVLAELEVSQRTRRAMARRDDEPPFVGRRRELAKLDDALERVRRGACVVATISGEPGMGKSSLLEAFAARAKQHGAQIYAGRCHETESVPYKGIDGVIDELCDHLAARPSEQVAMLVPIHAQALSRMFPVMRRVEGFERLRRRSEYRISSPQAARRDALASLRVLIARLTTEAPLILVIDDLQWASEDTAKLLLSLLPGDPPPMLLAIAHRASDPGQSPALDAFLHGLDALERVERCDVRIGSLSSEVVADMLDSQDSTITPERAMRETAGHPYLLTRMLAGDEWFSEVVDLDSVIGAQLERLGSEERVLLDAVSVAAAPLSRKVAFAAVGVRPDPLLVDRLRQGRLIHCASPSHDAPLEVYHDRVRETSLAAMTDERRRILHRNLARELEAHGRARAEQLAHHYRRANEAERALEWTLRAARNAGAALAFSRAVELYREAVQLSPDDATRLESLRQLAQAQVEAGRRTDAGSTCLEAAVLAYAMGDSAARARLSARAGEHLLLGGHLERGLQLLRDALAEVDVMLPVSAAVAVAESINLGGQLATRGLEFEPCDERDVDPVLLRRLDLELQVAHSIALTDLRGPLIATRAALDALDAGEPRRVQLALAYLVVTNSARAPNHPLILEALERCSQLARQLDDDVAHGWVDLADAFRAVQMNEHAHSVVAFGHALRRFRTLGPAYSRESAIAEIGVVVVCGNYGFDMPYAHRNHQACIDEALARGDLFSANWARITGCFLQLAEDNPEAARGHLESIEKSWPRVVDSLFAATSLLNRIAITLCEDPGSAWETVASVESQFRAMFTSLIPLPRLMFARMASSAAMAAHLAGRADRAETARRIQPMADDIEDVFQAKASHCVARALLCAVEGDREGYLRMMDAAARAWNDVGSRVHELTAIMRRAEVAGDETAAQRAIAELKQLGVARPDRYALVFAGPRPFATGNGLGEN